MKVCGTEGAMSEGGGGAGAGEALPRSRVSPEQLEMLLSFMEEHADFAAGRQSVYSRYSASKLWRLLAERLNGAAHYSGGARKSPDKWCRYWADLKYKARKKSAAGGALGELTNAEERLQTILNGVGQGGGGAAGVRPQSGCGRTAGAGDSEEEACSEGSVEGGVGARVGAADLLAEAAMRTALAAEKQAEAVAQGVELLRELVGVVRAALPPPAAPPPAPLHHDPHLQHHHHRL